jgi:RpiR family glv operon transcriptional regulator
MRIEEVINKHRADMNQTDEIIWKYIFNHRRKARHISIHELAKDCAVSSTTIVRFAQKLGFDGFGELKAVLKMEEEKPAAAAGRSNILQALGGFYVKSWRSIVKRDFDHASRLVHESNRIFAFASGYVQSNVVQEMKRLFFYDDVLIYEIVAREEFMSILRTMNKDDLVIIVSLSGETPLAVEMADALHLKDIPLISITRLHDNTLASLSTENLYVSPEFFQIRDGHEPFQSMMPYFLLVETWYVKYRLYLQRLQESNE